MIIPEFVLYLEEPRLAVDVLEVVWEAGLGSQAVKLCEVLVNFPKGEWLIELWGQCG